MGVKEVLYLRANTEHSEAQQYCLCISLLVLGYIWGTRYPSINFAIYYYLILIISLYLLLINIGAMEKSMCNCNMSVCKSSKKIWSGEKKGWNFLEEFELVCLFPSWGSVGFLHEGLHWIFWNLENIETFQVDFWPSGVDGISISQKFTMRAATITTQVNTPACKYLLLLVLLSH